MKKPSKIISVTLAFLLLFQVFAFVINPNVNAAGGALRVEMYMENTAQTTNIISPNFKIANYGVNSLNLSNVNIRYYFTKDSAGTQNFNCNVSGVTGSFTDMTVPTANADNYLTISFPSGMFLAPNTSIELKTGISRADGLAYNQVNDYSFSLTNTDYTEWSKAPAYINNIKLWGSEPVFDSTHGFLVIVSSKIYGACQSELNTYLSDLANEGWSPTLIKVNNEADSSFSGDDSFHVCENPSALKQVIKGYYEQGYKGFVIIGSAPSIPNAIWRVDPNSTDQGPTDLFYADMGTWCDIGNDGIYESYYDHTTSPRQPASPDNPLFIPDMIYGRISAGAISDSVQQEGIKTKAYLSKIHDLRLAGGNLSFEPKAFCFSDDDFVTSEYDKVSYLKDLERDVYEVSNRTSTSKDKFLELLNGGYRIGYETIHASPTGWGIPTHPYGTEDSTKTDHPSIDDINGTTIKVNYIQLNSCSACDYTTENLGEAFLFNNADTYSTLKNSYVYNVTGMTISSSTYVDEQYFEDLKSECIGTAFKNLMTRRADKIAQGTLYVFDQPAYVLLGDPTIKYNFTKPANRCPIVTNDLSDVNAYPNKPFKINFRTTDSENDPVFLDVAGLPEGASYDSNTKTIDWVPQTSQAGNSYNVTITAYNKNLSGEPANKYVQNFTIYVSRMNLFPQDIPNPGFELLNNDGTPSDWTRSTWGGGELSVDSAVKHSGNYSAKFSGNNPGYYELNQSVEPNTHYLVSTYVKTSNLINPTFMGTYFSINESISNDSTYSTSLSGTNDWTPVYLHWYSGDNTNMNIKLQFGAGASGTAWFDDFKVEKDYNLGFEFSLNNKASGWSFYSFNSNSDTNSISMSESSTKHNGLRSVSILSNQAPNYAFLYKNIPVEANTNYRVSAWVKTRNLNNTSTGASLSVLYGSNTVKSESVIDAETQWRQVYVDFNSGNNTSIRVNCRLGDLTGMVQGTAWFDDVTIEKK